MLLRVFLDVELESGTELADRHIVPAEILAVPVDADLDLLGVQLIQHLPEFGEGQLGDL